MATHLPLDQQVIAITGASSGIGRCTALLAAEAGASVVLIARSDETLAQVAKIIDERGGRALALHADVASREQLDAAVAKARDR